MPFDLIWQLPAIVAGTQNLTITNIARIKTTKVEFDPLSEGYIVTLNLTWQGPLATPLTESIVGKLKYIKRATVNAGTASEYCCIRFATHLPV